MTTTGDARVSALCNSVMVGVANAFRGTQKMGDLDRACAIMRAEIRSMLFGDEYAADRDCVLRGSLHQNVVIARVVTECCAKILAA